MWDSLNFFSTLSITHCQKQFLKQCPSLSAAKLSCHPDWRDLLRKKTFFVFISNQPSSATILLWASIRFKQFDFDLS